MNLNSEELKELDKYIERKILKIIKERENRYGNMQGWDAKVSSVNEDGTINVILIIDPFENIIPNLKNNTGLALITNDAVQLHSISTLKNAFIGIKK